MSKEFYDTLANKLSAEAESRNLKTPDQISNFVTRAVTIKYGNGCRLNIASIIADTFRLVNTGTRDLPPLPQSLALVDVNTPEIDADITQKSISMLKKYKVDEVQPKMDQIYNDAKIALGLASEDGTILRLSDEVDNTKLAKITTVSAHVVAGGNSQAAFNEGVPHGLKPIVDAVAKGIE